MTVHARWNEKIPEETTRLVVARYSQPLNSYRLPREKKARAEMGLVIGWDGCEVLMQVYAATTPRWLREVPALETLRRIWIQQYEELDGQLHWRDDKDLPPAHELIGSPFDLDARTSTKRETTWNGYKVHLTETCDPDEPHLVTNVVTTPATVPDVAVTPQVHDDLAVKHLTPAVHVVDAGYPDAFELAHAKQAHAIELLGPVRNSTSWQAQQAHGFQLDNFTIDWQAQQSICPQGHTSQSWTPGHDRFKNPRINAKFPPQTCRACPVKARAYIKPLPSSNNATACALASKALYPKVLLCLACALHAISGWLRLSWNTYCAPPP